MNDFQINWGNNYTKKDQAAINEQINADFAKKLSAPKKTTESKEPSE